jgi:hypothetical protein
LNIFLRLIASLLEVDGERETRSQFKFSNDFSYQGIAVFILWE